jgi:glycosyl transferase family 87
MNLRSVVWVVLAVVFLTGIFVGKIAHGMPDFEVYRVAAVRALAAEPLYRADDGHWQFKYLPAFAVAAAPLGLVPGYVARALWFAGSVALLVLLLRSSLAVVPERRHSAGLLIGATFVLLAKFYAHELELGQVNILMTTLVVVAVWQMRLGRDALAGVLVACAIVVKPYAVLLMPYLAARRRMASLWTAAAMLGVALLVPALVYGWEGNLALLGQWWTTVTGTTAPNLMDRNNVSALSVFTRWLGPGSAARILAMVTVGALLATAAFVFARRRELEFPEGLEVALLLTMMPILSPQGWDYVFLVSTPAVMYLVNYRDSLPRLARIAVMTALVVVAFSIWDVMGRRAYTAFMACSIITLCYLVEIAGLAMLRARRIA